MNKIENTVWAMAEPIAEQNGLELIEVEFVKEGADWYLRLYLDKEDGTVELDDCEKVSRLVIAAVTGSLAYCIMYLGYSFFQLLIAGSTAEVAAITMMTKAGATLLNAVVADVIAVPLFLTIRTALQRNHLWKGGKPGAAV